MFWIVLIIATLFFSWRNYKKINHWSPLASPKRKKKIV